ncbi:hypothetical protein [Joostella sp. CR20]|uniref:hypothetical protein n=1 Tax=Joostella sp. CR20 TaxID=2804312 RepID=UPI00313B421F
MSSNISAERRKRISSNYWRKLLVMLFLLFFFWMLIAFPFMIINIQEKTLYLIHKSEFTKKKVKIDSVAVRIGTSVGSKSGGPSYYGYDLLYNNLTEKISLTDPNAVVFISKQDKDDFNHFSTIHNSGPFYLPKNDSIWIWHHHKLKNRYATENELILDTSGFLIQIISNIIMVIIVIWGVIWQINKWIKLKQKK